jgi:colicin import membrane protein
VNAAVLGHDAFAPPRLPGMRPGLVLALIVHALLVLALAWSVNWKTSEPEGVVAELWSSTPQFAAPRVAPPEPQPEPPVQKPVPTPQPQPEPAVAPRQDAQIAIERAERERRQREDAEKDRLASDAAQKKKLAEKSRQDDARQAAIREANLRRMMSQAGSSNDASATGNATRTSGPSASYAGQVRAAIHPNIEPAGTIPGNPLAVVEVRLASDGTVISKRLVTSSGSSAWDDAVLRAIDKTRILPKDDGRVYSPMTLDFRPKD